MSQRCPKCGKILDDHVLMCDECGMVLNTNEIILDENGRYHWIYELPMLKSFFLLMEVWKVILMAGAIICFFMILVGLIGGDGLEAVTGALVALAIPLGIIFVLSLPAYYIVTKANNGIYTVWFEMDEDGIDHTQIKTDKAKALDVLTTLVGAGTGNLTTAGAGLMSAGGGSLYSRFHNVRKIIAVRKHNLIRVNGRLIHNMVYVDQKDFDFVFNYIVQHCPNAKVKE
ncbi:MAG: zinc ribbon domain-containing protein [Firmicutes bacterium]|nr:zinc ribbon domain-containing protein [Bacillota bacterium]